MQASDAHVVAASTVAESPKASSANARRAMCELAEWAMPWTESRRAGTAGQHAPLETNREDPSENKAKRITGIPSFFRILALHFL